MEKDFVRFRSRGRVRYMMFLFALFGTQLAVQAVLAAGDPIMRAVYASQAATVAVGFTLHAVLVARPKPQSLGDEVVIAHRFERITVFVLTMVTVITAALATHDARVRCASGAFGNAGLRCFYNGFNRVVIITVIASALARPRLSHIVALALAAVVAFIVGAAFQLGYTPTDYAVIAVILVICSGATCLEAHADEFLKRRNFMDHVKLIRAEEGMAAMARHAKVILSSAMPPELLNDDMTLAATTHRSDCATVGISDLYDFAQWSCRLLVHEVMGILDVLLTVCDVGATEQGVVRAMTYGDSCVVCAGLVSECDDHPAKVLAFEEWYIRVAARVTEDRSTEFSVRTSVCTGPVVGAVTGSASARYVLAGPAFDGAAAGLLRCEPPTARASPGPTVTDLRTTVAAAAPVFTAAAPDDAPRLPAQSPPVEPMAFAEEASDADSDAPQFSWYLLSFGSADHQQAMAEFSEYCEDAVGPTLAALPALVFAAFLGGLLIEYGSTDERRHHAVLPLVGVAVASILSGVVAALRWKHAPVPVGVLYSMTMFSLALGMVSIFLADCVLAAPRTMLIYLLAVPALFLRMPWLAQTAVQFVTVVVPSLLWVVQQYGMASGVYVMILVPLIVFFTMRYYSAKALCEQFVAARLTEHAVVDAFDRSTEHNKLLAGVLPPHAIRRDGLLVTTVKELRDDAMEQWASLSTLQVAMRGIDSAAPHALPSVCTVWSDVQTCVAKTGLGLLEIVQATGDTFLVAGPFYRGDDGQTASDLRQVETARRVVAVARTLSEVLVGRCVFKGIAATGTAFGALLGASQLSFRLFGIVVRESNALLAAAPDVDRTVAFASSSFRQQHQNFVAPRMPSGITGHMSVAALLSLRGLPSAATESADVETTSPELPLRATVVFGATSQWRVRGVGVAAVSAIRLDVKEYSSQDAERR
jgi:class 3 adenylate cyclase